MNHETLSEKTATPQTEQEPSQSDQKIAALTAVYDAVRRRVYENSEHSNHDINEATIILGDLIVCEACLSAGLPPEDLPLTKRTGYDIGKTLPKNIDLAIAAYLPDYAEKLPGLGYDGSGLAVATMNITCLRRYPTQHGKHSSSAWPMSQWQPRHLSIRYVRWC